MPRKPQEIGACEVRTHLARLLRKVAAGERFTITQRGKAVAELTPVHANRDRDAAAAAKGMQSFRQKYRPVAGVNIRALQDEGRD